MKECPQRKYGTANLYRMTNGENRGQDWPSSCSRKAEGMEPDDILCSRNARPQKALAWVTGPPRRAMGGVKKCAQWKINQPPSLKRYRASVEGWLLQFLKNRYAVQPFHADPVLQSKQSLIHNL